MYSINEKLEAYNVYLLETCIAISLFLASVAYVVTLAKKDNSKRVIA